MFVVGCINPLALNKNKQTWTRSINPYEIDMSLPNSERIIEAIDNWEKSTNIRFVERKSGNPSLWQLNYIYFTKVALHTFIIGMKEGRNKIYLSDNDNVGVVMHELGHAIGLQHEHQRPDRDNFVNVFWENIKEQDKDKFKKLQ
jgi:astacin